jgi:hypothetical protein
VSVESWRRGAIVPIMGDVPQPSARRRARVVSVAAGVLLILGALAAVLLLPGWLVERDLRGQRVSGTERLRAVNDVRVTLLQAIGGLAVGLGAYATWRRVRINEDELRTSREGQITERYSRAVEHLGSDNVDVRMGGIYALERVARNSAEDRETIVALLCAFVRSRSPWPPGPGQPAADTAPGDLSSLATRAGDVQAAVQAVCRMRAAFPAARIYLPRTDLRYSSLGGLDLAGANLGDAGLCRARLGSANLRGATLIGSDLRQVDLRDADLGDARLAGADLAGALANRATRWPAGFDPAAAGVALVP